MARNRVIGARGAIPWHLPNELKRFRNITMGHHLIMGRRTWESIGRPLPGRTSVVVTRQRGYSAPGAVVAHSLDEAVARCGDDEEVFVIGGAELYAQALPRASRLYLTLVEADVEGDTRMPALDNRGWRETASESFAADERHAHPYRCSVHERSGS
ncbi:MAG TPA: dihydrofolate reductase [Burkholderiales bacterium]|jgi:dihydrofolate reductase|nr:dihydrofolate reductase [Burkholderiales bacterium]